MEVESDDSIRFLDIHGYWEGASMVTTVQRQSTQTVCYLTVDITVLCGKEWYKVWCTEPTHC